MLKKGIYSFAIVSSTRVFAVLENNHQMAGQHRFLLDRFRLRAGIW